MSFMFGKLKQSEKNIVIDAMEEKGFGQGDVVIKQGEAGSVLFVVDEGQLDCYKEMVSHFKKKGDR